MGKIGDLWVKLKLKADEYKKGLDNAKGQTKSFTEWVQKNWVKVTGAIAGAVAAVKGLSSAIGIIADFEKANSVLAGVLGKTVDEIKALSESAEMLGRSTAFTATEVTNLQTELAKLGFGEGQIMSMQKAVLNFATALGVDLSEAAAFTGATLRTFGLRASDTEDALNVLAVASDKSALGFSKLNTAMPIVGPVAKSIGFDIRDTATLLGVLANSGFDASSSATALRNIFLYLADSSSKLTQAIGKPVKTLPDLLDGLDKLKSQGISVGEALELTDKRAVAAFSTLIDGTATARELRSALDDVNGAVDAKAQAQIDNVTGSVALLKSAWEGFILGMKNSKGVIKGIIDFLANGITAIGKLLFKSARVSDMQEGWQRIFSSKYNNNGKDKAGREKTIKEIEDAVKEAEEEARKASIRAHRAVSGSAFGGGKESKEARQAREELEAIKAAAAIAIDQITNDAVIEAVNEAGSGGTETAEEFLKGFMEGLSKSKDAFAEFRTQVSEEAEVMAADEEFQKMADPYEDFAKSHAEILDRINHKNQVFADLAQEAFKEAAQAVSDYAIEEQNSLDLADDAAQTALDNLQKSQERAEEMNKALSYAITTGLSDSVQAFTDMLVGLEDADASSILSALMQPFANTARQLGEMLIVEGIGIKAFKESLKSLNPYVALAAGAALVALGAALSSGIKALGSSAGSSSAMSSGGSSAGTPETSTINTEMTIYVKGKISGRDILISGEKSKKYYDR